MCCFVSVLWAYFGSRTVTHKILKDNSSEVFDNTTATRQQPVHCFLSSTQLQSFENICKARIKVSHRHLLQIMFKCENVKAHMRLVHLLNSGTANEGPYAASENYACVFLSLFDLILILHLSILDVNFPAVVVIVLL